MAWGTFTYAYSHLFVQDADEEEPLAGSQSCPGLARTEPIALLQSLEALEALMSWAEERETWIWITARQNADSLLTVRTFLHLFLTKLLDYSQWTAPYHDFAISFSHVINFHWHINWGTALWVFISPEAKCTELLRGLANKWVKALPIRANSNAGVEIPVFCRRKNALNIISGRENTWSVYSLHSTIL